MLKNRLTAAVVEWAPNHFAWPLVDGHEMSVKLEEIPIGGKSELHYHRRSRQFFFILQGEAVVVVGNDSCSLGKYDGIEVHPEKRHQISNTGSEKLLFLLISSPRVEDEDIFACNVAREQMRATQEL